MKLAKALSTEEILNINLMELLFLLPLIITVIIIIITRSLTQLACSDDQLDPDVVVDDADHMSDHHLIKTVFHVSKRWTPVAYNFRPVQNGFRHLNKVCSRHRCSLIQITLLTRSSISSAMSSLQPLTSSRHFVLFIASAVAVTSIGFYHKRRPTTRDIEEDSNAAGRRPVPKLIDSLINNNVSWLTIL